MKGYSSKHDIFLLCNDEFGMISPGISIKKLKRVNFDFIFDLVLQIYIPKYLL